MTFLELRRAIIECINNATNNLTPEEVYGVIASVEVEVRTGLITMLRDSQEVKE